MKTVLRSIDDLRDLETGWDSDGAPRISAKARESAKAVVSGVAESIGSAYAAPVVSPTPEGGVALVRRADERKVQVFTSRSGDTRYSVIVKGRATKRGQIDGREEFARLVLTEWAERARVKESYDACAT